MNVRAWIAAAERDATVFIAQTQPHPLGMIVGFASAAVGFALVQWGELWAVPQREALGWLALGGILVGMLLHWKWKRPGAGWRIDFAARRVEPVGQRGEVEAIAGDGWSIQTAPGERKAGIAIDLRHVDRGRVARLVDVPARRRAEMVEVSRLADTLARRLAVERTGPKLDA